MAEKSCLNCEHFAWWDGDYCCTAKFKILCSSPNGDFTHDILTSLRINKNCSEHAPEENKEVANMHKEMFDNFMKRK